MSLNKLAELKKQVFDAKARLQSEGREALLQVFSEFFNSNVEVKSVEWVQYTPYWNDGDVCRFRLGEIGLELTDEAKAVLLSERYRNIDTSIYSEGHELFLDKTNARAQELGKAFDSLTSAIQDKELLETLFGDHKLITVTRDGISVRKYDHD